MLSTANTGQRIRFLQASIDSADVGTMYLSGRQLVRENAELRSRLAEWEKVGPVSATRH
jgi:hypothetical protein